MRKLLIIILLLGSLPVFAQIGPGWKPQNFKANNRDSSYFHKDVRFNSTLRINENALRIGAVLVGTNGPEFNILDGALVSTPELNRLVGVTSGVQSQLNLKAPLNSPAFTGSVPTTGGIPMSRVYSDTMSVSAGVLRTKITSLTTEPYSVQLFSSGGDDITSSLNYSYALDGGVYKLYFYSSDALSSVKLRILY